MSQAIEWIEGGAYFTDVDGVRYRIYDVAFGPPLAAPGKKRVMAFESPEANHRYFISAEGVARAYHFTKNEVRRLSVERLEQQLAGAGFVSTMPRDIGALKPT